MREKEWVVFDNETGTLLGYVFALSMTDAYNTASDSWNLPVDDLDVELRRADDEKARGTR